MVMIVRVHARVERSVTAVDMLREEISRWLAARSTLPALRRFGPHLTVLETVLYGMLHRIRLSLDECRNFASSWDAYAACLRLDRSLLTTRRLFDWYAAKYDQRLHPGHGPVLAAADEVVRSCWWQPFDGLGRTPPPGPLPYLDPLFEAAATPRGAVPADLRAPADSVVAELVAELPIPVISLPAWAARESWWLVVAAHETGHLVMHELGLGPAVRLALGEWARWADEVFADVYSTLMVGPAAAWLVAELEHGLTRPAAYYPPAEARLALLSADTEPAAEAAEAAKAAGSAPGRAARALLDLPVDGVTLRELGRGLDPALTRAWTARLAAEDPVITKVRDRAAARAMIGAGVAAHQAAPRLVHRNLLAHLPRCGPDGTMGSAPKPPDVRALADRLAARVVQHPQEEST